MTEVVSELDLFKTIANMKNADLLKIAKTYGDPVYVYDASKIISQYNTIEYYKELFKLFRW